MQSLIEPPVRYSVGQDDFDPDVGRRLRILVDGVEQREVVEYDCEAGAVLKNKLGDDRRPQLNEKRDEILRETVTGNVTVGWRLIRRRTRAPELWAAPCRTWPFALAPQSALRRGGIRPYRIRHPPYLQTALPGPCRACRGRYRHQFRERDVPGCSTAGYRNDEGRAFFQARPARERTPSDWR